MWNCLLGDFDVRQRSWVDTWHVQAPEFYPLSADPYQRLCLFNFLLWHEEDKARDPKADDHVIAMVKRSIDKLNQKRNDAIEELDEALLAESPRRGEAAILNSETPSSMADRLFIGALRIYHMGEAAERKDTGPEHRQKCLARLAVLREQRKDLIGCLFRFAGECRDGLRYFKVYRQMKMYNDRELNPVLLGNGVEADTTLKA